MEHVQTGNQRSQNGFGGLEVGGDGNGDTVGLSVCVVSASCSYYGTKPQAADNRLTTRREEVPGITNPADTLHDNGQLPQMLCSCGVRGTLRCSKALTNPKMKTKRFLWPFYNCEYRWFREIACNILVRICKVSRPVLTRRSESSAGPGWAFFLSGESLAIVMAFCATYTVCVCFTNSCQGSVHL